MPTRSIRFIISLLVLSLGSDVSLHGQNAPAKSPDSDNAKHKLAISLLRGINTAEADYKMKHGVYASWETLLASEDSARGMKWAAKNDPHLADAHFSNAPDILPGWSLRLNLTADAQHYDLLLQDKTDDCVYAAVTNESGLIWQAKNIQCPI